MDDLNDYYDDKLAGKCWLEGATFYLIAIVSIILAIMAAGKAWL